MAHFKMSHNIDTDHTVTQLHYKCINTLGNRETCEREAVIVADHMLLSKKTVAN